MIRVVPSKKEYYQHAFVMKLVEGDTIINETGLDIWQVLNNQGDLMSLSYVGVKGNVGALTDKYRRANFELREIP